MTKNVGHVSDQRNHTHSSYVLKRGLDQSANQFCRELMLNMSVRIVPGCISVAHACQGRTGTLVDGAWGYLPPCSVSTLGHSTLQMAKNLWAISCQEWRYRAFQNVLNSFVKQSLGWVGEQKRSRHDRLRQEAFGQFLHFEGVSGYRHKSSLAKSMQFFILNQVFGGA